MGEGDGGKALQWKTLLVLGFGISPLVSVFYELLGGHSLLPEVMNQIRLDQKASAGRSRPQEPGTVLTPMAFNVASFQGEEFPSGWVSYWVIFVIAPKSMTTSLWKFKGTF